MGVQLPKIVRVSTPHMHTHTHTHTHCAHSVHRGGHAVDSVLACLASQGQQPKLSFAAREISHPNSVGIFLAAMANVCDLVIPFFLNSNIFTINLFKL